MPTAIFLLPVLPEFALVTTSGLIHKRLNVRVCVLSPLFCCIYSVGSKVFLWGIFPMCIQEHTCCQVNLLCRNITLFLQNIKFHLLSDKVTFGFLARLDEVQESYYITPGVGVSLASALVLALALASAAALAKSLMLKFFM